ncbi:MAG: phasin family protein [Xanthobacteraceae bacterium]|nr:phasin family protein [Xanthobacteraceae bacterium]
MNDVENVASEMEGATKTAAAEARHAANEVKSAFEAYQEKLMEIAKENMAFAMEFGQAITAVRSPTDFLNVTNDFTRRRFELFQQHTSELMAVATPRI